MTREIIGGLKLCRPDGKFLPYAASAVIPDERSEIRDCRQVTALDWFSRSRIGLAVRDDTVFYRCTPSIEVNPPSMGSTAPVM